MKALKMFVRILRFTRNRAIGRSRHRLAPVMATFMLIPLIGCSRSGEDATSHHKPNLAHVSGEEKRFDFSHGGRPAPDVVFTDESGRKTTLSAFRGHPVLLSLWATWCGPCIKELPSIDALAGRDKAVTVIALNQDKEGAAVVLPFWKARRFTALRTYFDPANAVAAAIGMSGLPAAVLYDKRGKEVWRASGGTDWAGPTAARMIAGAESRL